MGPADNLALAALVTMALAACVPGLVFAAVGYFLGRAKRDDDGAHRGLSFGCGGFVLGAGLGALAIVLVLYLGGEDEGPQLRLRVPADFAHSSVLVLVDPTSPVRLRWNADRSEANLPIPDHGVVRVRSLETFANQTLSVARGEEHTTSGSSRSAPAGLAPVTLVKCAAFAGDDCEREDVEVLVRAREGG